MNDVRISFGIIVLNGEPYTRYCIRNLYEHAFEIIVSEGACVGASSICTLNGHSKDGTLEVLKHLKEKEDPENKITIVTAEDEGHSNGFWPGEKHEQSQAYAKRANGNYLWQIDIDEFYKKKDIQNVKTMLMKNPGIMAVSFKQIQFWGSLNYAVDSWYLRRGMEEFHRLFRWESGFNYKTHRPPTITDNNGIDIRNYNWIRGRDLCKKGIFLYHYSFVFPKQVKEKALYYRDAEWSKRKEADWWANDVYLKLVNPYRVFSISTTPSWLYRFKGSHPEILLKMMDDIRDGKISAEVRETTDIDRLVNSVWYNAGISALKILDYIDRIYLKTKKQFKKLIKKILKP